MAELLLAVRHVEVALLFVGAEQSVRMHHWATRGVHRRNRAVEHIFSDHIKVLRWLSEAALADKAHRASEDDRRADDDGQASSDYHVFVHEIAAHAANQTEHDRSANQASIPDEEELFARDWCWEVDNGDFGRPRNGSFGLVGGKLLQ